MDYYDVISLEDAKLHLRVDNDFVLDDDSIKRMIKSALEFIEETTNHIVYQRNKTYNRLRDNSFIAVFDYPINSYPTEQTKIDYPLRSVFHTGEIELSVGYANPEDVPSALIDAALMMIDNWYYEHEKEGSKAEITDAVNRILATYRRCITV